MPPATRKTVLMPTIGLAGAGFLAGFVPADAQAQAAAGSAAPGPAAVPEVNVSGDVASPYRRGETSMAPRMAVPVEQLPQSVSVIPREVMQEQAVSSVRDALRNVTGISLSAGEGGFSGDNLTLRGFSARGDFFIDGIRDIGQYTRDPFFLDEIQVFKGPSAIIFGRGSTGGVINQVSRLPVGTNTGQVAISGYSPDGLRTTGDVNIRAGDVAARFLGMASTMEASGRDNVEQRRWGFAPSITLGYGLPTSLTLSWLHQEESNVPDYGHPYLLGRPAPVARSNFYGLQGVDTEHTTTDVVTARLEHRFDDRFTVRNTTRYGSYGRELSATAPRIAGAVTPATNLANVLVNRQPQVRDGYDSLWVNQTEVVGNVRTGPLQHNLLAGFEVGRESSQALRFAQTGRPLANFLNPDWLQGSRLLTTPNSNIKTVATTYGVYANDQVLIGEQWEVLIGGRWDSFDAEQTNRGTGQTFSRLDEQFSWRAGLVFKPVPSLRTYVAAGTAFNPSAEALTLAANNAELPPEETISYELGVTYDLTPGLRIGASVFRIEKDNARTSDPANATLQVLDGKVRVDGFEVSLVGRLTPEWNVMLGYTHLASEIVRSTTAAEVGKEFANVPPNSVAAWTTYNLPYGVQVGGGLSFVDRRFANTTNTTSVPSYTRYDAAVSWEPGQDQLSGQLNGVRVQFNVLNLTDERTYDTVYTGHVVPGIGRTFVLTTSMRW